MELANLNMTHHENNYCTTMMAISTLKTDGKGMESMEYVWRNSSHVLERELEVDFKTPKS